MGDDARSWYVRTDGADPVGPVSTDLVRRGLEAGKIPDSAEVRQAGETEWTPIRSVPALAPPPPAPSSGPASPTPSRAAARAAAPKAASKPQKRKTAAAPKAQPAEPSRWAMPPSLAAVLGAAAGYLACYYLLLDGVGRIASRLFWRGLADGQFFAGGVLLRSTTFWEPTVSTIVGGIVGWRIARPSVATSLPHSSGSRRRPSG